MHSVIMCVHSFHDGIFKHDNCGPTAVFGFIANPPRLRFFTGTVLIESVDTYAEDPP